MNYKTSSDIQNRVKEHLDFALEHIDTDSYEWFVICAQGSMNYGLMDDNSDVDTKMLVVPSLRHMALNKKPISTTLVLENNEHCDVKDVREYFKIVRKEDINFIEIFFTEYFLVNPKYADLWYDLTWDREEIARANEYRFLKCCKGMLFEKSHALSHPYPSKLEILAEHGYDSKQLCHALRVLRFAQNFICEGEKYYNCLRDADAHDSLMNIKHYKYPESAEEARVLMDAYVNAMCYLEEKENENRKDKFDPEVSELLDEILVKLVSRYNMKKEKEKD